MHRYLCLTVICQSLPLPHFCSFFIAIGNYLQVSCGGGNNIKVGRWGGVLWNTVFRTGVFSVFNRGYQIKLLKLLASFCSHVTFFAPLLPRLEFILVPEATALSALPGSWLFRSLMELSSRILCLPPGFYSTHPWQIYTSHYWQSKSYTGWCGDCSISGPCFFSSSDSWQLSQSLTSRSIRERCAEPRILTFRHELFSITQELSLPQIVRRAAYDFCSILFYQPVGDPKKEENTFPLWGCQGKKKCLPSPK